HWWSFLGDAQCGGLKRVGLTEPTWKNWATNMALLLVFVLQHSLMASRGNQYFWHRSAYIMCTSLILEVGGILQHFKARSVADNVILAAYVLVDTYGECDMVYLFWLALWAVPCSISSGL